MLKIECLIGVVVIYKNVINKTSTLLTLNTSLSFLSVKLDVIIYDNSPNKQSFSESVFTNLNCTYFHDPSNPGVSKAYNYAAIEGEKRYKKFILVLDQDTTFPQDSLMKYLEGINLNPDIQLFCPILHTSKGIFSPTKYYFRRGFIWKDVKPGKYNLQNKSALNSGMLINLAAYNLIGGYNDKIQLYFSDFDFINRFKQKFKFIVVLDIQCKHTLSDIVKSDLFSAVGRFNYYVNGSYNSILNYKDYMFLFFTILLRSIKLSLQYRNPQFLNIFFKKYLFERLL